MTTPTGPAPTATTTHDKYNSKNFGFSPSFGFNLNITGTPGAMAAAPAGGSTHAGGGNGSSHFLIGEPEFNSTDDVARYCNNARAAATQLAIEIAIAAKILEARLSQAQAAPGDHAGSTRMRARRVSGKLKRTADAMTAAAKNAVATHGALVREYQDLIQPRAQRPGSTSPFRF